MESVLGFLARVGGVLLRPRRTLRAVAAGAGGLSDILILLALRLVAGELPQLARAVVSWRWIGAAGALAIVTRAIGAVLPDLLAVAGGAIVMALLVGRRTLRGRELDVAGYAWVPYLAARLGLALVYTALGRTPEGGIELAVDVVALAASAVVWVAGLLVLRALPRNPTEPLDFVPDEHPAGAVAAGGVVMLALGAMLAWNGVWVSRNVASLRPVGTSMAAPDFQLTLLGGGSFHLRDEAARGPTVIDFFATWCGPCREELPSVNRLYKSYRDRGVRVVAVNVDAEGADAAPKVSSVQRALGLELPIALDGVNVADRYRVDSLPHLVVLDRNGEARRVLVGVHAESELRAAIDDALAN